MKKFFLILAVASLITNAFLGYAYWQGSAHAGTQFGTSSARAGANRNSSSRETGASDSGARARDGTRPRDEPTGEAGAAAIAADPQLAAALKSREPHELLAALRTSGFPDNYVRNIMIWELGDTTREKRLGMLREAVEQPFWRVGSAADERELDQALDALDAKNLDITKDVFGGKVPPLAATTPDQRRYAFLPADKFGPVYELVTDYSAKARSELAAGGNPAELETQMHTDLAKILSPPELELYDLNLSRTALVLRSQMSAFETTEQEFRDLYAIRREFDQQNPSLGAAARAAGEAALNDQYRAALGEARFAEFQRSQNRDYRAAFQVVQHYQLPMQNAAEVYALRQSVNQRLQEIRRNPDPNAVRADSQALTQEVNARLTQLLGAQGADAYSKITAAPFSIR